MSTAVGHSGLDIRSATKVFAASPAPLRALDDVSLHVRAGEFFVLLGPSGCGKSTLLRAIAGLETLDHGEVWLGDGRIDQLPAAQRPVNTVFQHYALFPHLSVAQNIAFGLEMERADRERITTTVTRLLDLVHLAGLADRRPHQLSGGQQQRVALARALAKSPQVLLLDEPLSALDLKLRRGMQDELKALQDSTGVTFVFVTHDQEEALSLGDRIAVMDAGRVAQVGTPAEVYEQPVNRFVADFIGETTVLELSIVEGPDGRLVARLPGGPQVDLPPEVFAAGPATVAIRPERVQVTDPEAPGSLRAVVERVTYAGADQRLTVDVAGTRLKVRLPAGGPPRALKGDVLGVFISGHDMRLLAPEERP